MQAIGLLETKGLLAAVEGADAMVKSADVSIVEKSYVGGGLVTITVTGDVGAVKAAVEAGVAAVRNLSDNLLISNHVIPRPHEDLESIIGNNSNNQKEAVENIEDTKMEAVKITNLEYESPKDEKFEVKEEKQESDTENVQEAEISAIDFESLRKKEVDDLFRESGMEQVFEVLNKLKVVKLRNLAREYEDFGITGRAISKADKKLLLIKFKAYYEKK